MTTTDDNDDEITDDEQSKQVVEFPGSRFKDGAYYCHCAYVLCISRYWDFLSLMLTNTGIFCRGSKLYGKSRSK